MQGEDKEGQILSLGQRVTFFMAAKFGNIIHHNEESIVYGGWHCCNRGIN